MATSKEDVRDKIRIARCGRCKSVLTKEDVIARNVVKTEYTLYHKEHFCCTLCENPISGLGYAELNKKVVCTSCWEKKSNPICTKCDQTIADEAYELFGNLLHRDCVKCYVCNKTLVNVKYYILYDFVGTKRALDKDCYYNNKYKLH